MPSISQGLLNDCATETFLTLVKDHRLPRGNSTLLRIKMDLTPTALQRKQLTILQSLQVSNTRTTA